MSLTISWFTTRCNNRTLIAYGMFLTGLSQLLVGPSNFLPDSLLIMSIGQFMFGGLSILFLITSLPEMIKEATKAFPNQKYEASDISSGIFNSMLGLGQMLSPIYGSYVTQIWGFRTCATSVACMLIIYSFMYYKFCTLRLDAPQDIKDTESKKKK